MRRELVVAAIALSGLLNACGGESQGETGASRDMASHDMLRFTALAAGSDFTCGIAVDGKVWCWGSNDYGQLGVGDRETRAIPTKTVLASTAVRIVAGETRMCAVDSLATLHCWGDNSEYALGDTVTAPRDQPMRPPVGAVRQVAAGSRFTCAVGTDRGLSCWGGNRVGELGIGADSTFRTPVPQAVPEVGSVDTLVAGRTHACALTTEGAAWCWGDAGRAGDGRRTRSYSPVPVAGGHRFVALAAGQSVTCGVDAQRAAWCWGVASDGQLGNGEYVENEFVPVRVSGDIRFVALAAGYHRVCGLDDAGAAWCWGSNHDGALGDTARASSYSPTRVLGNREYVSITAGDWHTCAIDREGAAWCWGRNRTSALGDGATTSQPVPVPVSATRIAVQ